MSLGYNPRSGRLLESTDNRVTACREAQKIIEQLVPIAEDKGLSYVHTVLAISLEIVDEAILASASYGKPDPQGAMG